MSQSQEAVWVDPVIEGVPIYRVTLVRESTVAELPNTPIRKSSEAAAILRRLFAGLDREQFAVLLVDAQHRPIGINVVSIGSLTASIVHPPEAFKAAILANAAAVIVAHNHFSGTVNPSPEDIELSRRLARPESFSASAFSTRSSLAKAIPSTRSSTPGAGRSAHHKKIKEQQMKHIMNPLSDARSLWAGIEKAVTAKSSSTTSSIRKQWKRSWARKVAWPWLKREVEVISKVTGVVVVSLWLKRLVEQFLGKKVLNEPVLRGEVNDIVRGIEDEVEKGRSHHARTQE